VFLVAPNRTRNLKPVGRAEFFEALSANILAKGFRQTAIGFAVTPVFRSLTFSIAAVQTYEHLLTGAASIFRRAISIGKAMFREFSAIATLSLSVEKGLANVHAIHAARHREAFTLAALRNTLN
jgi:hypothetical protein